MSIAASTVAAGAVWPTPATAARSPGHRFLAMWHGDVEWLYSRWLRTRRSADRLPALPPPVAVRERFPGTILVLALPWDSGVRTTNDGVLFRIDERLRVDRDAHSFGRWFDAVAEFDGGTVRRVVRNWYEGTVRLPTRGIPALLITDRDGTPVRTGPAEFYEYEVEA